MLLITSCGGRPLEGAAAGAPGSPGSAGVSGAGSGGSGASGEGGAAGNPSLPVGGKMDASAGDRFLLQPNSVGFVDGTNAAGIIGVWYAFSDGYGPTGQPGAGKCQLAGHTDCSVFTTPVPGAPFPPDAQGRMCTKGHAAVVPFVIGGTAPDYSNVYGANIALDLNNPGFAKESYDAVDHKPPITGFAFDIDVVPPNSLHIELATSAVPGVTDYTSAYWGGATQNASPVVAGHNVFRWPNVGGPPYLVNPPPFDPTKLLSIFFHVVTNTNAPVDFAFCISNLTALTN